MVDYDENSVTSELSFSNDHKKNKVYPNKHREGKSEKEKENARKWGKRERERVCVCVCEWEKMIVFNCRKFWIDYTDTHWAVYILQF